MVVPSTKLEGLSDALEMTDVIIETAKQLKASLNQAKRANTPAALAAASATLGLARTVVTFSRDAHILLQKSVPAWLPTAPTAPTRTERERKPRPKFDLSPAKPRTAAERFAAEKAAESKAPTHHPQHPAVVGSLASPLPAPPNARLSYAENFLYMLFATPLEPYKVNPIHAKALDVFLILHADHEQNASTSTVRIAGSSMANPYACIAAGIASLWGPAHGGANEAVLRMLAEIGCAPR